MCDSKAYGKVALISASSDVQKRSRIWKSNITAFMYLLCVGLSKNSKQSFAAHPEEGNQGALVPPKEKADYFDHDRSNLRAL